MSSFCTAKATHIFFSKKFQHICVSLDLNFNELLTNYIVSFEQLGPAVEIQENILFDNIVKYMCIFCLPSTAPSTLIHMLSPARQKYMQCLSFLKMVLGSLVFWKNT